MYYGGGARGRSFLNWPSGDRHAHLKGQTLALGEMAWEAGSEFGAELRVTEI